MLASATAWMFNAWKFFLQTYAGSSGLVIPFMGMRVQSTAPINAVWQVCNLMKIRFNGLRFTYPFRKVHVVYGCIDSIAT